MNIISQLTRRDWLAAAGSMAAATAFARPTQGAEPRAGEQKQAQIAITLDLEMSRNFPEWEMTHWDYEKGNLNAETKRYSVEAARRVKAAGGVLHFFAVGRVFEQPDISWLQEIVNTGHPVGNHTYDHVNVTASRVEDLQYRFQRAPWLLRGQSVHDAIRENIILTNQAMKSRLGIAPAGFRTPGGFGEGLIKLPAVRNMLKELGFDWISSLYPPHPNTAAMQEPSNEVLKSIVDTLPKAQPFAYPDGLIEIPMSPISDIGAFRTGRWKLEWFLKSIRQCMEWTIENGAVFDFLAHPSCLYVADPQFKAIDLICQMVREAGERAQIVDLGAIAKRVRV
jgi:hypothetical protein